MGSLDGLTVAVLGGTGPQGRGLVRRWAAAGIPTVIGSRDPDRAAETAAELAEASGGEVRGLGNADAAAAGDVVVVSVPYDGHAELLRTLAGALAGKVVVDCVNPIGFDKQGGYPLQVPDGSAAQEAAALLPESIVVAAFHHISAVVLNDPEIASVDTDVLVLGEGEHREATDLVRALADAIPGVRGGRAPRTAPDRRCRSCGRGRAAAARRTPPARQPASMPAAAWDAPEPGSARSSTTTPRPRWARRQPSARPITPPPTIATSTVFELVSVAPSAGASQIRFLGRRAAPSQPVRAPRLCTHRTVPADGAAPEGRLVGDAPGPEQQARHLSLPLCGHQLHAMSEHVLIAPEGDAERRRHAHRECVLAARAAGRLPTRDEWLDATGQRRPGLLARLRRRMV